MKEQKKLNYSLLGILTLCILCGVCFAHPVKTEAATFKMGSSWKEGKTKAGNYYLWISDSTLYASTSKTGKGKAIAKAPKGHSIEGGFLSDGSTVFYTEFDLDEKKPFDRIYSVKINGKKRTLIAKVKKVYSIQAYYNGNLYIACGDFGSLGTYRLNTKTKKGKNILKDATPFDQYKQYLLFANGGLSGESHNAYIFNCKTEKAVKISNKVMMGELNFASGKVYYAEKVNGTSVRIKSCSLTGKNKKILVPKLSADIYNIGKITSKYVDYMKDNKYYRYNIKTKKSKKISKNEFWKQ